MRHHRSRRMRSGLASLLVVAVLSPLPAAATPATSGNEQVNFEATPISQPKYGVAGPEPHTVLAEDGTQLHVDVWLPKAKDGNSPPKKLPVILVQMPYDDAVADAIGRRADLEATTVTYFVERGYAFAIGSVRGTGRSGGCIELFGPLEVSDTLRVVEHLADAASWGSGRVGMLGHSYEATTALGAATSEDRQRSRYIKAVVAGAGGISLYDTTILDGVADWQTAPRAALYRAFSWPPLDAVTGAGRHAMERPGCAPEQAVSSADVSGDYTPFYAERDYRPRLSNLRAATLMQFGFGDLNVWAHAQSGFLDRFPADTPHKHVVGQWEHNPRLFYSGALDGPPPVPYGEQRVDWLEMVQAWFDRYLMDLPTGVEDWPNVQVQGLNPGGIDGLYGRWRQEPAWPRTGGPVGHLALDADGALGGADPSGATTYREASPGAGAADVLGQVEVTDPATTSAVFQTEPLAGPVHLTGQPSLQLWVQLEESDAHVAAVLEAFDQDGRRIAATRTPGVQDTVFGARSARHLDPLVDGGFRQAAAVDPPTGPFLMSLRLSPLDLLVPERGTIRLTIAGNFTMHGARNDQTIGSGTTGAVTILHDCVYTSVLRFLMPRPDARWLDVPGSPTSSVEQPASVDGGGLATTPVCGQPPARDEIIGPVRTP